MINVPGLNVKMFCLRVCATFICLLWLSLSAVAQPGIGDAGRPTARKPEQKTTRGKPAVQVTSRKEKPTLTTGSLAVAAESSANLLVEPVKGGTEKAQVGTMPPNEGVFIFNGLKPQMRYRVAGTLEGYHDAEVEVTVQANKSVPVTLNFKPILHSIDVRTNVENGSLKYWPRGRTEVRVVDIRNKSAHLELRPGTYEAEIDSGDFGYETLKQSFVVEKPTTLNFELKRIEFSENTYAPIWTNAELKEWEMPATWQASGNLLLVKGPGVGLPKAASRRFYKDFKVETTVKTNKPVAVSFALRAQNTRNYYLLQVTGEKSDEPYMLRLFLVKDGVARRVQAVPYARSIVSGMSAGEYFVVSVKMIGFVITVRIEDSRTGAGRDLSALADPDQTFPFGAVGIAAGSDEDNVVERFIICSKSCLSN